MKVSYQKVSAIALDELSKCKYLYFNQMVGVIGTILDKSGVDKSNPIPDDCFIAIKEAISDEFHGGMEPEFDTKEQFDDWTNMNSEHYMYITEKDKNDDSRFRFQVSPYKDKTITYLVYIK